MGANFGDLDNDGFQDMYFGTGDPDYSSLWPNIMLRNDSGQRFQDVTASGGFGHLQKGHGIAFGDLDNDGDQDLFVQMGGMFWDDAFFDVVFENPGHGNHWVTVKVIGKRSNKFGIGARIKVKTLETSKERDIYTYVGSTGTFGASSLQQEIGLGQAERIISLEVLWPTSGIKQIFTNVPLDRFLEIEEGAKEFRVVERRKIRFP
jgi:hypothetical protein